MINKKKIYFHFLKNRKKVLIRFLGVIVLILLVIYLVPSKEPVKFNLLSEQKQYYLYINNKYPEKRLGLIINELLGTALNLSWNDVCFSNNGSSNSKADNIQIVINLLPIASNQLTEDSAQWAKNVLFSEPNNILLSNLFDNRIIQTSVTAGLNGASCISISANEKGFLYTGELYLLEQFFDKNTKLYLNEATIISGNSGDDTRLASAILEVKINNYALNIKRFIVFTLFIGLFATIWKIICFIFCLNKSGKRGC